MAGRSFSYAIIFLGGRRGGALRAAVGRSFSSHALVFVRFTGVSSLSYLVPPLVLGNTTGAADLMTLIWSGFGDGFTLHVFTELSVPTLVGLGTFLKTQWGVLLMLSEA